MRNYKQVDTEAGEERVRKRDIAELYGAINYIAAAIIVKQEDK